MKWFYNLKIAKKLFLSFSLVLVLVAALGGFSLIQLNQVNLASSEIATNWLPSVRTIAQIKLAMSRARSFELQYLLATTPERSVAALKGSQIQLTELDKYRKSYAAQAAPATEKEFLTQTDKNITIFVEQHVEIMALAAAGKKEEALALLNAASTNAFREAQNQLEKLTTVSENGVVTSHDNAAHIYASAKLLISAFLLITIVVAFGLAIWVAKIVSQPLEEALDIAKRVANGDLSAEIHADSTDETGQLMHALKAMNDNLLTIVTQVRTGTDAIQSASSEIASGNLDLSSRTEQQAGSLEETASAMEKLTSTVKQNAENARLANQLAVSSCAIAVEGGSVVGKVVNTMEAINTSSRKIVNIISVIDSIAFQTNILALNAAVEAARAGEQGRGFAVVASEVRSLAQRSAAAAKEIKELIGNSVANVEDGTTLVAQAGSTMNEVVASVQRVTDIVGDISLATQEQSKGLEEVNQAITQMDDVTQQNAALVEQAAAAARSLQEQAGHLSQAVDIFKLRPLGAAREPAAHARSSDVT